MSLVIDLRPELEADLMRRAARRGMTLMDYVGCLLEAEVSGHDIRRASPAERAAAWRAAAKDLPPSSPLSEEAVSRDSIYSDDQA